MATRRIFKTMENETPWQSTPFASRTPAPTKDMFENRMPFARLPSPVLSEKQSSEEGKHTAVKNGATKLTTLKMVVEAIEALGQGRKGSSVPAIKKWILGNYPDTAATQLNYRIRKALAKGLEDGRLERSTKSSQMMGARGFFIVKLKAKMAAKKDPKKKPATSKPAKKADPGKGKGKKGGHVSDSEVTIIKPDRRKSAKRHVSDTDLPPDTTTAQMKTKVRKTTTSNAVSSKAKKGEKPKVEKKTSRQKTNDPKKSEKHGKTAKADVPETITSKDKVKKTAQKTSEKPDAKKKEKPPKNVAAKGKKEEKVGMDSSKTEQLTTSKKSSRKK